MIQLLKPKEWFFGGIAHQSQNCGTCDRDRQVKSACETASVKIASNFWERALAHGNEVVQKKGCFKL